MSYFYGGGSSATRKKRKSRKGLTVKECKELMYEINDLINNLGTYSKCEEAYIEYRDFIRTLYGRLMVKLNWDEADEKAYKKARKG